MVPTIKKCAIPVQRPAKGGRSADQMTLTLGPEAKELADLIRQTRRFLKQPLPESWSDAEVIQFAFEAVNEEGSPLQ